MTKMARGDRVQFTRFYKLREAPQLSEAQLRAMVAIYVKPDIDPRHVWVELIAAGPRKPMRVMAASIERLGRKR